MGNETEDEIDWSLEPSRPKGGQQVEADPMIIVGVHRSTGVTVRVPRVNRNSQHKRKIAAKEAIEWILHTLGHQS